MKKVPVSPSKARLLQRRYERLLAELTKLESLSQGSVMKGSPAAWRWTRKVAGKTVSLGLSADQAVAMKRAITNQRKLDKIVDELRAISQTLILGESKKTQSKAPKNHPKSPLS